jgi:molybdopterin synthase catalytic subunit
MSGKFVLSSAVLEEAAVKDSLDASGAGGIVTFVGQVRAHSRGREVTQLEYEAYPEMAEAVFVQIAQEAKRDFDILDIAIHHRIGNLTVGEISVVVAVAAAHRAAAFDAARFAIDTLKRTAPIWKKEHGADGAVWVEDRP